MLACNVVDYKASAFDFCHSSHAVGGVTSGERVGYLCQKSPYTNPVSIELH